MNGAENRLRSARRHLDVFEETWKADHDEAMDCRDFEGLLDQLTSIFRWVARDSRSRREHVFRGLVAPSPDLDAIFDS